VKIDLKNAWQRYLAGDLRVAEALCLAMLSRDCECGRSWELLGLVYYDMARTHDAIDAFERASLSVPISNQARIALAASYADARRVELARDLYLETANSPTVETSLLLEIALGLHRLGINEAAFQVCKKAVEQDPSVARAHYDMGFYGWLGGRSPETIEHLIRFALELDPTNLQYLLGMMSLLVATHRTEEAIGVAMQIPVEQYSHIRCRCCLRRLERLVKQTGDTIRIQACESHLTVVGATISSPRICHDFAQTWSTNYV
jgi:tetratricopeptide (TPR) repeat protein